jgi:Leucine-rich repeat (LRR) protein
MTNKIVLLFIGLLYFSLVKGQDMCNVNTTLEGALANKENIEILFLNNQGLKKLPDYVGAFVHLQAISADYNNFRSLPKTLSNSKSLGGIHVDNCKLEDISVLASCKNLIEIRACSNQINEIPTNIGDLTQLSKFFVAGNHICKLPESFSRLKNILELSLADNEMVSFPNLIFELSALEALYLNGNRIKELDNHFDNFKALEVLDLRNNQISNLPASFYSMTDLESLYLSNNKLTSVSEKLKQLEHLKVLNLSDNQIEQLPQEEGFIDAYTLETLLLGNNRLSVLPQSLENGYVRYIDVSGNRFTEFPAVIYSMHTCNRINLSKNAIKEVDERLLELNGLKHLDLSDNKIYKMPSDIYVLRDLEYLDISNNRLTKLPKGIEFLRDLSYLNVKGNNIPISQIENVKNHLPYCEIVY